LRQTASADFAKQFDETIDHIISACPILTKEQYIKDMIECVHSYTSTCAGKQWYSWTKSSGMNMCQKSVETSEGGKVTILWNQQVQTDRTVPNNKPDIIICDNEKGTCMLIDVAMSGDRNVIKKEAEKILKCKDLTKEITETCKLQTVSMFE